MGIPAELVLCLSKLELILFHNSFCYYDSIIRHTERLFCLHVLNLSIELRFIFHIHVTLSIYLLGLVGSGLGKSRRIFVFWPLRAFSRLLCFSSLRRILYLLQSTTYRNAMRTHSYMS